MGTAIDPCPPTALIKFLVTLTFCRLLWGWGSYLCQVSVTSRNLVRALKKPPNLPKLCDILGEELKLNVKIFEKLKVGETMLSRKVQITRCHVVSRPVRPCLRSAYWGKYLPSQYSQSRIPRLEGRRDHHTIISGHSSKRQL